MNKLFYPKCIKKEHTISHIGRYFILSVGMYFAIDNYKYLTLKGLRENVIQESAWQPFFTKNYAISGYYKFIFGIDLHI